VFFLLVTSLRLLPGNVAVQTNRSGNHDGGHSALRDVERPAVTGNTKGRLRWPDYSVRTAAVRTRGRSTSTIHVRAHRRARRSGNRRPWALRLRARPTRNRARSPATARCARHRASPAATAAISGRPAILNSVPPHHSRAAFLRQPSIPSPDAGGSNRLWSPGNAFQIADRRGRAPRTRVVGPKSG